MQKCDLCITETPAIYDCRIPAVGIWAYICQWHYDYYQCSLGTGKGSQLAAPRILEANLPNPLRPERIPAR